MHVPVHPNSLSHTFSPSAFVISPPSFSTLYFTSLSYLSQSIIPKFPQSFIYIMCMTYHDCIYTHHTTQVVPLGLAHPVEIRIASFRKASHAATLMIGEMHACRYVCMLSIIVITALYSIIITPFILPFLALLPLFLLLHITSFSFSF